MNIVCDSCRNTTEIERTPDIPEEAHESRCNWCPNCEDDAAGYWEEYYVDKNGNELTYEYVNGEIINVSPKV